MKLLPQQLETHLKKTLLPIYLIAGNEPLLIQEAKDLIRETARTSGFAETQYFEATKDFDWNILLESANNMSLFCEKSWMELKLVNKPSALGAKVLNQYIENIPPDKLLFILSEKLDAATQKTSWFQAINKVGGYIPIWPLDSQQLLQWIQQRLTKYGLICDNLSVRYLAEQTEGNLLATAQEIEKLKLLFPNGSISYDDMVTSISDNARFDVFALIDAISQGNPNYILRIISRLQDENVEPTFILWALTREIRTLINIHYDMNNKVAWEIITKKYQIWEKQQSFKKRILKLQSVLKLHQLLLRAIEIDKMIKGITIGNYWETLIDLALELAGLEKIKLFYCRNH